MERDLNTRSWTQRGVHARRHVGVGMEVTERAGQKAHFSQDVGKAVMERNDWDLLYLAKGG